MLRACRTGRGIAIGSLPIVAPDLASGRLVRISDVLVTTDFGYYMTYDPMLRESRKFRSIVEFLKKQAEGHSRDLRRMVDTGI
jgi:LysR family glycine cleavage system transcriptional activator